jgi:3-isopropylmalate/(R)-2-methylmalate dehydratase small subunit
MESSKRTQISGRGIVVRGNDIDTDRIIPARYLRTTVFEGLGANAFQDDRADVRKSGGTHPFDDARFSDASVLLVNKNFGCGSSREHAPQAIMRWGNGIRLILGESFSEIFYGNCIALGVPCPRVAEADIERAMTMIEADPSLSVNVDMMAKKVTIGDFSFPFEMSDGVQRAFIEGRWDSTGELIANGDKIRETARALPYFNAFAG